MARGRTEKNYFGFNSGLITEGSKLQYVPESVSDIDNFVIRLNKGLRRRRGLDYEANPVVLGNAPGVGDISLPAGVAPVEVPQFRGIYKWVAANGESGRDYVFLAVPNLILCYSLSRRPLSGNLLCYIRHDSDGMVTFASHGPWLVMGREGGGLPLAINIERDDLDKAGGEYVATPLTIRARDFGTVTPAIPPGYRPSWPAGWGAITGRLGDAMQNYEQYTYGQYAYDLLNGGWNYDGINSFSGRLRNLPSKGDVYSIGVGTNPDNGTEQFRPQAFQVSYAGPPSAITPRGRFILDVYSPSRNNALVNSGFSSHGDVPNPPSDYVTTVASYAGRMWYGGKSNKLYYTSQIRDESSYEQLGNCYQEQDPTATDFNDLLATDGGALPVAGGGNWQALIPFGNSLIAMNTTGVWEISGREGVMSADNISVRKLSGAGVIGKYTPVTTDAALMFWTENGIDAVVQDPTVGTLGVQNLTDNSIYELYSEITNLGKMGARGVYDTREKKVYWFYNKDLATTVGDSSKASNVLIYDMRINGFYKFTISDADLPNFPPPPPPPTPPDPINCRKAFTVDPFAATRPNGVFRQPTIINRDGSTNVRMQTPSTTQDMWSAARTTPFDYTSWGWTGQRLVEVWWDKHIDAGIASFQMWQEGRGSVTITMPQGGSVQVSVENREVGGPSPTRILYPPKGQPIAIGVDGSTGDVYIYVNGVSLTHDEPLARDVFNDTLYMRTTLVPNIFPPPGIRQNPEMDTEFDLRFGAEAFSVGYPPDTFDWCGNYSVATPDPGTHPDIPLVPPFVLAPFIEALTYDDSTEEIVYVGDEIVYVGDEVVTVPIEQRTESEARVKFFIYTPQPEGYGITVGDLGGNRLRDWYSYNNTGVPYLSYVEAGYDTLDDPKRIKEVSDIFLWFEITEDGVVVTEPEPPPPEPPNKEELEETYAQHCTECEVEGACSPELTAACQAGLDIINDDGATQEEVDDANDEILQWSSPEDAIVLTVGLVIPASYEEEGSDVQWTGAIPSPAVASLAYSGPTSMSPAQANVYFNEWLQEAASVDGLSDGDIVVAEGQLITASVEVQGNFGVGLGPGDLSYTDFEQALQTRPSALVASPRRLRVTESAGTYTGGTGVYSDGSLRSFSYPYVIFSVTYPE